MKLHTIGFAEKSAEQFFAALVGNNIERVVDLRLKNLSQMAGFTKRNDLEFFLRKIADIEYLHLPIFAPTKEIFEAYRENKDWGRFEKQFQKLLEEREPLKEVGVAPFIERISCLLCSESSPEKCHRRLVAEYIALNLGEPLQIIHL